MNVLNWHAVLQFRFNGLNDIDTGIQLLTFNMQS